MFLIVPEKNKDLKVNQEFKIQNKMNGIDSLSY